MNVGPGDLAMVVRNTTGDGCTQHMVGTPVHIVRRGFPEADGPWWTYRGATLVCPACSNMLFYGFLDADLQRLRGPEAKAADAWVEGLVERSKPPGVAA